MKRIPQIGNSPDIRDSYVLADRDDVVFATNGSTMGHSKVLWHGDLRSIIVEGSVVDLEVIGLCGGGKGWTIDERIVKKL